ncbi:MAG: GH3 auxin-responsive promoter family protein [Crocinitomicaceae bacterium]
MPFNSIFSWFIKKRIHQIDLFKKYPIDVQNEVLSKLITLSVDTQFGCQYNFISVKDHKTFQDNVPLSDYNTIKKYVDQLMAGDKNILWPGDTKWFAKSSGTTAERSKFIPVTKESLEECHYKAGKDLLALYYSNYPGCKLYNGKHLAVGGSAQINPLTSDSYFGDLSAIIVNNLPWWAEIRRTPSKEITMMSEWEEKIEKMAHSTIKENVLTLAGVPSWTIVLAERILEITGKKHLKEVWPNLELFMHGGVCFEPYRDHFAKLIPDPNMHYVETYNASEGFFGIQDLPDDNALLLMLDYGIYYEFIPMNEFDGINSKNVLALSEVEEDVNYAVVISTNGGLWRYILGDTVKFTSLLPYRFKITGRTKSFINTFGEELIVENAEQAIAFACENTNANIRDYTAGPIYMDNKNGGGHEWVIEFSSNPNNRERFEFLLDTRLREINSDYDAKRYNDMILSKPFVHYAQSGFFESWLKGKGKLGGQNKIPRLSNNREILEQILPSLKSLT